MRTRIFAIAVAAVLGTVAGSAFAEPQPHMRRALEALEQAKGELERATHDKGGHRMKAIEHINLALAQIREGIAFDNKN